MGQRVALDLFHNKSIDYGDWCGGYTTTKRSILFLKHYQKDEMMPFCNCKLQSVFSLTRLFNGSSFLVLPPVAAMPPSQSFSATRRRTARGPATTAVTPSWCERSWRERPRSAPRSVRLRAASPRERLGSSRTLMEEERRVTALKGRTIFSDVVWNVPLAFMTWWLIL